MAEIQEGARKLDEANNELTSLGEKLVGLKAETMDLHTRKKIADTERLQLVKVAKEHTRNKEKLLRAIEALNAANNRTSEETKLLSEEVVNTRQHVSRLYDGECVGTSLQVDYLKKEIAIVEAKREQLKSELETAKETHKKVRSELKEKVDAKHATEVKLRSVAHTYERQHACNEQLKAILE